MLTSQGTNMAKSIFSPEKPNFELEKHHADNHDEVDIYGVDHQFTFVSGNAEDIASYSAGIVTFRVGGELNNPDESHCNVGFSAWIHFPPVRKSRIEGKFISEFVPQHDELETIASGLMNVLAVQPIKEIEEIKG